MARLIFEKASITAAGTNASTSDDFNISGIVTESISMTEEALQVAIEDNQNINEGYTTTLTFRTRNLLSDNSVNIAESTDASSLAYCGGSSVLAKKVLRMYGVNGGDDFFVPAVYVMGRRVYENGREEVEISCQIDSTGQKIVRA